MIRHLLRSAVLSLGLLSVVAADSQMRVVADDVNVRCGPGTRYEIVCQAHQGDLVTVRRTIEEWSEIAPPADARLWVYAELIENAKVIASRVQIRSGPGISYRPAGTLDQGTTVAIEETSGDWARIAPPNEASVWIHSEYLAPLKPHTKPAPVPPSPSRGQTTSRPPVVSAPPKPVAPTVAASRPKSATPSAKTVVATPHHVPPQPQPRGDDERASAQTETSVPLPVALRGRRLADDRKQGEWVRLEGEIRTARSMWGKLSGFRLVGHDAEGRIVTRCYLLGNPTQLASIVGRRASIDGRKYWVHRVRYPGVRPDRIRLYPER